MAQQARAVHTRMLILEAAAAVFSERGYGSATISEILARTGVTKGALYFHFASKEELALGVMGVQFDVGPLPPQQTRMQELVDQGMVLAVRLQREPLVRAGVGLAMDQGVGGLDRGAPFRAWISRLEELLEAGRARGELLAHVNPAETAELLAGAFSGIQEMSQVLCGREDLGRRVSVLMRHVLPSVATPAVLATLDLAEDRGGRLLAWCDPAEDRRQDEPVGTDEPADSNPEPLNIPTVLEDRPPADAA